MTKLRPAIAALLAFTALTPAIAAPAVKPAAPAVAAPALSQTDEASKFAKQMLSDATAALTNRAPAMRKGSPPSRKC